MSQRCFACMHPIETETAVCPKCGHDNHNRSNGMGFLSASVLQDQYFVGRILGRGGFGVTYLGYDLALERVVAIKEYFPASLVARMNDSMSISAYSDCETDFRRGCERALREGRTAAKLGNIPGVVQIYNVVSANNTIYIIMEYIDGVTLTNKVKERGGVLPWPELKALMDPVMDTLQRLHEKRVVHRDIKPDNIMIRKESGEPVILDFGAARENSDETRSASSAILSNGYAPLEQYDAANALDGRTDEYALCATMIYALTGERPMDAIMRTMDVKPYKLPCTAQNQLTEAAGSAIARGFAMQPGDRFESVAQLKAALDGKASALKKPEQPISAEEKKRLAEERWQAQQQHLAQMNSSQVSTDELAQAEARRKIEEQVRLEARRKLEEKARLEEQRKREEQARAEQLEAEKRREEQARLEEQRRKEEQKRLVEQRWQEQQARLAQMKQAEEKEKLEEPARVGEIEQDPGQREAEKEDAIDSNNPPNKPEKPEDKRLAKKKGDISIPGVILALLFLGMIFFADPIKEFFTSPYYTVKGDYELGTYILTRKNTLMDYRGRDEQLVIPEEIDGKRITAIGRIDDNWNRKSYPENLRVQSIVIPDSVTELGEYGFSQYKRLREVVIPDSVKVIGKNAFSGSAYLEDVNIPGSVKRIEAYAFHKCRNLKTMIIPNSVEYIGEWAFGGCVNLKEVVIPASVTEMEWNIFDDCPNITLYVKAGSVAEKYAQDRKMQYVVMGDFFTLPLL